MKRGRDLSRRAVALFFVVLLCVGLLVRYDFSTDESTEMFILKSNGAEYVAQLFGEDSGLYAFYQRYVGNVKRISDSVDRDHGTSAYYVFLPAMAVLQHFSNYAAHIGWQCYTFMLFMLGVVALYGIARELFHGSHWLGCTAALLLYLTPRMFAEGHYNNKDVVLLSLVLLTIWLGVRLIQRDRLRDALLFSLAGAFATNTKIIGGWFWGVFGILYIVMHIRHRNVSGKMWRNGLVAVGAFLLFYLLLTPAMWNDPLGFLKYLLHNAASFSRWHSCVMFEGKVWEILNGEPLPWYYLPKLICMTTPIPVLLLSLAGVLIMAVNSLRFRRQAADAQDHLLFMWAIFVAFSVLLCIGMFAEVVLYNGWRHFYFFYAALMLFSLEALCALRELLADHRRVKRIATAALAAYFAYHGISIACNHPLQGSYYNPIAAPFVQEDYETDYWLLGNCAALQATRDCKERNSDLELSFNGGFMTHFLADSFELRRSSVERIAYASDDANYYVEMVMYDAILEDMRDAVFAEYQEHYRSKFGDNFAPPLFLWEDREDFHLLLTIEAYGIDIVRVYERNA